MSITLLATDNVCSYIIYGASRTSVYALHIYVAYCIYALIYIYTTNNRKSTSISAIFEGKYYLICS